MTLTHQARATSWNLTKVIPIVVCGKASADEHEMTPTVASAPSHRPIVRIWLNALGTYDAPRIRVLDDSYS
jgi:hypothetical protein